MAGLFQPAVPEIEKRYPRQCEAIRGCIAALGALERENCPNPDEPAGVFGQLMGELLVYREDLWADTLRQMGMALGRFIYIYDACLDLEKDLRRGSYNPLKTRYPQGVTAQECRDVLTMLISQCTKEFEGLPILRDDGIIRNVLYSGVWLRRDAKFGEKGDGSAAT